MKWLCIVFSLALLPGVTAAESTRVFEDGFEAKPFTGLPAGWAMWGAQEFKIPSNYAIDTNRPHAGQSCFRIHHPSNTRGYIVSAADRAIQPKARMLCTVSFWARAERPAKALFQWTAYRSIKPFVDAPSPGSLSYAVEKEWRQFEYTIREGLDFFADESRFLLLTFNATAEASKEQTLWIDDVRVVEAPDPNPVALINSAALPHEAIEHPLRPGDRLEFSIDVSNRVRRATAMVGGISFHRVCGWTGQPYNREGKYTLHPQLEEAIRELHLPMTRIYGVGDEPFSVESSLDKVAELCRRVGVAQEHCVLEFEEQGASRKLSPETWSRGVSHSLAQGYGFHYWEIANEPSASLWGHGEAFPTPEAFIDHFRSVSRAIRKADPQAQVGMDINPEQVRWGNYLLKQLAGEYDFVAPHFYCGANVHKLSFEDLVLRENFRMLDGALKINALLKAYNGSRPVYQYDTEWGMICSTADGKDADFEDRNANIIGTLHRAVRLIYYARGDILRGASGWQMFSRLNAQGFGILSQEGPDQRAMLYWLYYYFNHHMGEWVLQTDGTAPYYRKGEEFGGPLTPVLATLSGDGARIFLIVANGSWKDPMPCQMSFTNFSPQRAIGVVLSNDSLEGKPFLHAKEDAVSELAVGTRSGGANCRLPPHSVAFITLQ